MITIDLVEADELILISSLANEIWPQVYKDTISSEQITFMLQNMYTIEALQSANNNGQSFYVLNDSGVAQGFIAIQEKPALLRLEKLYLKPESQGKGFGKMLINFASEKAVELKKKLVELNVNRKNKAVQFYLSQGFEIVDEVDIPYHDFVLDDYVMQRATNL